MPELHVGAVTANVAISKVTVIDLQVRDGLRDGLLGGLGTGALVGAVAGLLAAACDNSKPIGCLSGGGFLVLTTTVGAGVGAGLGVVGDLLVRERRRVYERGSTGRASWNVMPTLGPGRAGLTVMWSLP